MKISVASTFLLLVLCQSINGQFLKDATISTEFSTTLGTGTNTPFYFLSNRYGLSSIEPNSGYLKSGLFRPIEQGKRFTYGYGAELAVAANYNSTFVVQQLYGEVRYRTLGVILGAKQYPSELKDAKLSSGGLTHSMNARPVPQLRAGFIDYFDFPGTNGWLQMKGVIAFGMETENRFVRAYVPTSGKRTEGTLYHYKNLFVKMDKEDFPLFAEAGAEFGTQFGGVMYQNGKETRMPGWEDFFRVLLPLSGGEDAPITDQMNVNGNVVGSWHLSLGYRFANNWKVRAYYEHFFEDHSMMFMQYPWYDGFYGLEISFPKNPFITRFVYEHNTMKDQAGPIYWDQTPEIPEQISARDSYYNHGLYNGWQHWGMGMGNPFVLSPLFFRNKSLYFPSNRVKTHHIGILGNPSDEWEYRLLASYSDHWGTYNIPFNEIKSIFSGMVEVTYMPRKLTGWSFTAAIAGDNSDLIDNSFGGMLSIKKSISVGK